VVRISRRQWQDERSARGRKSNENEASERASAGAVIKPQAEFPTARSTRHASHRPSSRQFRRRAARPPFIINAIRSYYAPLPYALPRSSRRPFGPQSPPPLLYCRLARIRARNSSPYSACGEAKSPKAVPSR